MQPSQDQNLPSGELPSPQQAPEQYPQEGLGAMTEQQQSAAIEQGIGQGQPPAQVQASPTPLLPPLPIPPPAAMQDDFTATQVPMPQIADDSDLIEKEWVTKAKHIVEQTKHDPYVQNLEVNKMKADYLKKRYNKDLKLSDS